MKYAAGLIYDIHLDRGVVNCRMWRAREVEHTPSAVWVNELRMHLCRLAQEPADVARALLYDLRGIPSTWGPVSQDGFEQIFGAWEAAHRRLAVVVDDDPRKAQLLRETLQAHAPRWGRLFRDAAGAASWCAATAAPHTPGDGPAVAPSPRRPGEAAAAPPDTPHLHLEHALSPSPAMWETLPVGIIVHSGDGARPLSWNSRALDLLGLTADELQGRAPIDPRWNLLRDDGRPLALAELPGPLAIARKSPVLDVLLGVFAPTRASRRWLQCSAVPKLDRDGEVEHVVCTLTDVTELKHAEEYARARVDALTRSSTPLLPIAEHVVVMPLIGVMDAHRGPQMLETLLQGIAAHGARVAILDVTGVSVVDAQAADALLRAVRAARLLGTEVVLSGIRPSVAQGILALHEITACGTLQAAVAFALRPRG